MKFKKTIVTVLSVFVLVSIWYTYADQKIETQEIAAKIVSFDDAASIEDASKLIVSGIPLSSENHVTYDEKGFTKETFTITQFKINKVLLNKSNNKYNEGDTIKVAEPFYIVDNGIKPGKTRFELDGYQQMKSNENYLLVLVPDVVYTDMYVILGTNEGKHNIDDTDTTEKNLSNYKDKANKIKAELFKKYQIN